MRNSDELRKELGPEQPVGGPAAYSKHRQRGRDAWMDRCACQLMVVRPPWSAGTRIPVNPANVGWLLLSKSAERRGESCRAV